MRPQVRCNWQKPCRWCRAELDIEDFLIFNRCPYCHNAQTLRVDIFTNRVDCWDGVE